MNVFWECPTQGLPVKWQRHNVTLALISKTNVDLENLLQAKLPNLVYPDKLNAKPDHANPT